ncbi:helix-turn-helix domain-containing protein [Planosporangium sp. 12N6]|uniref:helix-turn-helix domain-containing protein n=1 Tax=Planosporangium spinosum TaxID=3402278 RepID=UPI003CF02E19
MSPPRQAHLVQLHAAGEDTIAKLAKLFEASRSTLYRLRERAAAATSTWNPG